MGWKFAFLKRMSTGKILEFVFKIWFLFAQDYSVQEYKKYLVDPAKIVVSIPAFGRSYTLANPESHLLGAKANDSGAPGPYTRTPGWISFNEVKFL